MTSSPISMRTPPSSTSRSTRLPSCAVSRSRSNPDGHSARSCGGRPSRNSCSYTAEPRTPIPGTPLRSHSAAHSWPLIFPAMVIPMVVGAARSTPARMPRTSRSRSKRWLPGPRQSLECRSEESLRLLSPDMHRRSFRNWCWSTSLPAWTRPSPRPSWPS